MEKFRSFEELRPQLNMAKVVFAFNADQSFKVSGKAHMVVKPGIGDPARAGFLYIGSDYIGRIALKKRQVIFDRNKDNVIVLPLDSFLIIKEQQEIFATEEEREIARIRDQKIKEEVRQKLDSRKNRGESKRQAYFVTEDPADLIAETFGNQPVWSREAKPTEKPMDAIVTVTCGWAKNSHKWETTKAEAIKFHNTCPEHRAH